MLLLDSPYLHREGDVELCWGAWIASDGFPAHSPLAQLDDTKYPQLPAPVAAKVGLLYGPGAACDGNSAPQLGGPWLHHSRQRQNSAKKKPLIKGNPRKRTGSLPTSSEEREVAPNCKKLPSQAYRESSHSSVKDGKAEDSSRAPAQKGHKPRRGGPRRPRRENWTCKKLGPERLCRGPSGSRAFGCRNRAPNAFCRFTT